MKTTRRRRGARWVYLPLPWLTEHTGIPHVARAPARLASRDDSGVPPPEGAVVLLIRIPPARIIAHIPDKVPGAECYDTAVEADRRASDVAWNVWVDRFLCQVIRRPAMTESEVQALGPDRDALASGLLRLWSWIPDADGLFPHIPNPTVVRGLRLMAKKSGRLPSQLLERPFDRFVFDWRVLGIFDPKAAQADVLQEAYDPFNGPPPASMIEKD